MERTIITIIAAALIGLGAWNLNQTFNLSLSVEQMKAKMESIEKSIAKLNKKKKNKGSIMQQSN
ncbi:hypothetical protein [uncultured Mediterranean phage]|jgi:hypothetical protein|nr:hypothetical protein [uncultured Mediterranean phage]|tara:strand:- start:423 stop:614 length:192 start_codon:yes stop_codon:yes gene_type:complete